MEIPMKVWRKLRTLRRNAREEWHRLRIGTGWFSPVIGACEIETLTLTLYLIQRKNCIVVSHLITEKITRIETNPEKLYTFCFSLLVFCFLFCFLILFFFLIFEMRWWDEIENIMLDVFAK